VLVMVNEHVVVEVASASSGATGEDEAAKNSPPAEDDVASMGTTVWVMTEVEAGADEEPAPNAPLSVPLRGDAPSVGAAKPLVPVPHLW
jgi:hypothetical protein